MIIEFIIMSLLGSLLHFTYDISKHNKVVGLFSAVNESTWEHIKIALSAFFVCSIVDGFFWASMPNYFLAKFFALITIILLMPLIFYGYKSLTKKPILIIDISSFYVVLGVSQLVFNLILNMKLNFPITSYLGILGVFLIFGFYMILTLFPMENFLFVDPITKKYGLKGHPELKKNKTK